MVANSLKGIRFIQVSGIFNCLLALIHFIVLYFTYQDYSVLITPEAIQILDDALLFSIAVGITLLFVGMLTCYCYTGIKHKDRWAFIISSGISVLLFSFAISLIVVMDFNQPIAYIHLLNSLMISIPLVINKKDYLK